MNVAWFVVGLPLSFMMHANIAMVLSAGAD